MTIDNLIKELKDNYGILLKYDGYIAKFGDIHFTTNYVGTILRIYDAVEKKYYVLENNSARDAQHHILKEMLRKIKSPKTIIKGGNNIE